MKIFIKKLLLLLSFLFISYSAFGAWKFGRHNSDNTDTSNSDDPAFDAGNLHNHATVDSLLRYAYHYIGTPYRSGNSGPNAFDCSGFTRYIFGKFGYDLIHNSGAQSNFGISVSKDNLQPGDLVFFKGRNSRAGRIGHVGIVSAINPDGTFSFIHASCSKGVANDNSQGNYYAMRYVTARRIVGPENYMRHHTLIGRTDFLQQIGAIEGDSEEEQSTDESPDWSEVPPLVLMPEELLEMDSANADEPAYVPQKIKIRRSQSLVSIARKYGCSVSELKQWNHIRGNRVRAGHSLFVEDPNTSDDGGEVEVSELDLDAPSEIEKAKVQQNVAAQSSTEVSDSSQNEEVKEEDEHPVHHTVEKGETLLGLAIKYNCSVSDLKEWNGLTSSRVQVGQELRVVDGGEEAKHKVEPGETITSLSDKYDISINDLRRINHLGNRNFVRAGETLRVVK